MSENPSPYKSPEGQAAVAEAYDQVLELWPVPHETLGVPTRLGRTHVIACGAKEAPPLVLLHGGGNCALMWIYAAAELSRHFRVYAPDVIGDIGKSVPSRAITRMSDYTEWFGDTLDGLGLERTHVTGISWGGGLALSAALSIPNRLNRIVSMCPVWGLTGFRAAALLFRALFPALFPSRNRIRKLLQWFSATDEAFRGPVDERLIDYLVVAFKNHRSSKPMQLPVFSDEELRSIQTPTLVLIGEREVIYPDAAAAAERARRLIPGVTVESIPNAGHALFYDRPEIVNRRIVDFLSR
ncbi:alpha/beta hydrolase [Archangium sp.]|uniref:alpha/beta fold hydrolase n=1 Tax=Archangium sp. TaxID=1872627 RepID=UPI002D536E84|nr:alpha/beta hydrolase [Archangium sp.]HYO58051.1 alpha/beta hydrolase [Archangium sp.]